MTRPVSGALGRALVGVLLSGLVLMAACSIGDLGDLTRGFGPDGGADARADSDARAALPDGAVCDHAFAPERPATQDLPSIADVVFAADDLRVDNGDFEGGLPRPLSLDLDGTCSCPEPPSCVAPSTVPASCDESNGRDNATGALLARLALLTPTLEPAQLRARVRGGSFTFLVSVQNWNGTDNDPDVLVNIMMSAGIAPSGSAPRYNGNDVWSVDSTSLVNGDSLVGSACTAVFCVGSVDVAAYVRDGLLVARFPTFSFTVNGGSGTGSVILPFTAPTLTARLTRVDDRFQIAGELVGRIVSDEMLLTARAIKDPVQGTSLCASQNAATYEIFKKAVCSAVDLAAEAGRDRMGDPCKAMSGAIGFTGSPAKLGRVVAGTPPSTDCPSFTDTCPP